MHVYIIDAYMQACLYTYFLRRAFLRTSACTYKRMHTYMYVQDLNVLHLIFLLLLLLLLLSSPMCASNCLPICEEWVCMSFSWQLLAKLTGRYWWNTQLKQDGCGEMQKNLKTTETRRIDKTRHPQHMQKTLSDYYKVVLWALDCLMIERKKARPADHVYMRQIDY